MLRMPASKQIFLANKQGWPCPAAWAGQHHQINVEQKCGERGQGLFIKCVELMITGPSLIRYQKLKIEVNNYYSFAHCECFIVAKSWHYLCTAPVSGQCPVSQLKGGGCTITEYLAPVGTDAANISPAGHWAQLIWARPRTRDKAVRGSGDLQGTPRMASISLQYNTLTSR